MRNTLHSHVTIRHQYSIESAGARESRDRPAENEYILLDQFDLLCVEEHWWAPCLSRSGRATYRKSSLTHSATQGECGCDMQAQSLTDSFSTQSRLFATSMHLYRLSSLCCAVTRLVRDDFKGQLGAFTPCFTDIVILGG